MKHKNKLFALFLLTAGLFVTGCSDDDDSKPSAPQISTDASQLSVGLGETETFTITVSAAGKFKEATATATLGTATIGTVDGAGKNTATVTISYVAPTDAGTATINVTATDEAGQTVSKDIAVTITTLPDVVLTGGNVDGVWGPSRTYIVRGNLTVPAGKTLTIKEGVTVIMDGDGSQGNSPEITVAGNLYSYGTEEKPVLFTVPEASRKEANIFAGLWGGVLGTESSQEMVILYTRIEYAGGPAAADSPIVTSGEVDEGDPRYGLYFTNPNGKFVMMHSTIAYTKDDGMRINQGQLLIAYNEYYMTGETGGEALNVKSGCTGDVAFNVFYQAATNGIKWSNSDGRTPQTDVNVYNNTAINCGWRQLKAGRGGSFNLEKGGRGKVYNNIAVNCRFGVRFPLSGDAPDVANSAVGYSLYYGSDASIVTEFYPSISSFDKGEYETSNDVSSEVAGENDPKFKKYTVTGFDIAAAKEPANIKYPAADMDFSLQAGSPALGKGKVDFTTKYTSHTVAGTAYAVPAPANYIGARGQ